MDLFGFEEDLDLQNTNVIPCNPSPVKVTRKSPVREQRTSLSISQIQNILRHELNAEQSLLKDSELDSDDETVTTEITESTIPDTSIFEEPVQIDETLRPRANPKRQAAEKIKYKESSTVAEETDTTIKKKRNPKKKTAANKENEPNTRPRRKQSTNKDPNITGHDEDVDPNVTQRSKNVKKGLQARDENKIPKTKTYVTRKSVPPVESGFMEVDTSIMKRKRKTKKKQVVLLEETEEVQNKMEQINNQFKAIEEYHLLVEK